MFTRGRVIAGVIVIALVAVAYTGYLAFRTERDLRAAQASVARLQRAIADSDDRARNNAYADLRRSASSAAHRTGGLWWGALTVIPFIGDDAGGVEALSTSLDTLSSDAIDPLFNTADNLDGLVTDGQVDLRAVRELQQPVRLAHNAVGRALAKVDDRDSSDYLGIFAQRFDEYRETVKSLDAGLGSAETAVALLPRALGGGGARDYLFVFQNNAEVRASGGLAGAWARIHAEKGRVELREQGSALKFNAGVGGRPVTDVTSDEQEIWGDRIATFFQNPGLTRDFPRSAEIFDAFWNRQYPSTDLDGVVALDPVALSYLLKATGPITVGNTVLNSGNIVDTLLSKAYVETSPAQQNVLFQQTAATFFDTITTGLPRPVPFVQGLAQAGREGRFLFAPFDAADQRLLRDSRVLGRLTSDEGSTPHVDIGVNDITQSKMSYYLRYSNAVTSRSCEGGVQQLTGTMTLRQTIAPGAAQDLPDYITGTGDVVDRGNQLVGVQIYAPFDGSIRDVRINGDSVDIRGLELDGRPVADLAIELSNDRDIVVTWMMTTGAGQTAPTQTAMTPSIRAGTTARLVESTC